MSNLGFCTLFDSNYLTRGLALIESLLRLSPGCRIWVLCMDDRTAHFLTRLGNSSITVITLDHVSDADLIRVRTERTLEEFCWTCTPVICEYILRTNPQLSHVIYVDADVMFFGDPKSLFDELGEGSILIFEHGFPPQLHHVAEEMGRFNVEVIVFRNDPNGRACLAWWRERCIEWCYHRVEPGRLGDQKYLDLWPELFKGVVVASQSLVGLAPWNFESYKFSVGRDRKLSANGTPILFTHFAKLQLFGQGRYQQCGYEIPPLVQQYCYEPYIAELDHQWNFLRSLDPHFRAGLVKVTYRKQLRTTLGSVKRRALAKLRQFLGVFGR